MEQSKSEATSKIFLALFIGWTQQEFITILRGLKLQAQVYWSTKKLVLYNTIYV
jgi:hypothetical protein